MAAADRVHRDLRLTTPLTVGPDVKALQRALNRIERRFPQILRFDRLDEDGVLGEKTLHATLKCAHVMGLIRRAMNRIEKEHVILQHVQRMLRRDPDRRTPGQKQRAERRRTDLRRKLRQQPSLARVQVTTSAGNPHWGGSGDVMNDFVEPFMVRRKLPIGSGKRSPQHNAAIGGSRTSDHLTTKTRTAARDFPTFAGEDDARALARALGIEAWRPNAFTAFAFSAGGRPFRAQILWGAAIQHGDHVHVGISPG
jgi:Peptidase M15